MQHSTGLCCGGNAACSSEDRWAEQLSRKLNLDFSPFSLPICKPRELPRRALRVYRSHCQPHSVLHYSRQGSAGWYAGVCRWASPLSEKLAFSVCEICSDHLHRSLHLKLQMISRSEYYFSTRAGLHIPARLALLQFPRRG